MMISVRIGKYRLFVMNESSFIHSASIQRFYWKDKGSSAVRARDKKISNLYTKQGLTQQEIAQEVNISQVRVSRILRTKFKFTSKDRGKH